MCSTGNPCTECAAHNRECVYDEAADRRRKAFTKFTQEQLQYYRGFLERLLDSIRYGDRDRLDDMINVIRSGASMDEIAAMVDQILGETNKADVMDEDMGEEAEEGSEAMSGLVEGLTLDPNK
ncbi:C6 finger domain protein [Rasamsonia emersonii CBS 393.64]|uniref:C6 finger domain protein n=1 Tax=Rasamsonia emersonii (strain ATCC 16479 / CBS 393.64 / IMI 116815) TaxID=1408163 RepID=A0A0F4YTG6_RASE3|nr:C6 finger domain protein [Rasamsonia emersonii CBS 393.64]KKA21539.1 C6 finger domain protein [Rasamsonia emersonii CBS 393.64]